MLDNIRTGHFMVFDASLGPSTHGKLRSGVTLDISSLLESDTARVGNFGRCHGAPVFGCVATPNVIWK